MAGDGVGLAAHIGNEALSWFEEQVGDYPDGRDHGPLGSTAKRPEEKQRMARNATDAPPTGPDQAPGTDDVGDSLGSVAESVKAGERWDDGAFAPVEREIGSGPSGRLENALERERQEYAAAARNPPAEDTADAEKPVNKGSGMGGGTGPGRRGRRPRRSFWGWWGFGPDGDIANAPDCIPDSIANLLLRIRDGEPWTEDELSKLANITGFTSAKQLLQALSRQGART